MVVSPLSRAIQTASIGFANATTSTGVRVVAPPFVATSLARERVWVHTCDRRRSRAVLEAQFAHVDFSEVAEGDDDMWAHKEDEPSADDSRAASQRARLLLQWLWERPERDIAIVTHWVFLRQLFRLFPVRREWSDRFGNVEMRHVTLTLSAEGSGVASAGPKRTKDEV